MTQQSAKDRVARGHLWEALELTLHAEGSYEIPFVT